jgi:hypothetical protein
LLLLVVIQFGLAAIALAEPSKLTGEALRQAVSGRTVLFETPNSTLLHWWPAWALGFAFAPLLNAG